MNKLLSGLLLGFFIASPSWGSHSSTKPLNQRSSLEYAKKNENTVKNKIMKEFAHWRGTRYKFGGTTKKGVDCSSFVQQVYRDALKIKLPRTTAEQKFKGTKIAKNNLRAGDLVFFRGNKHVGIYIGNNQFIHSGSKTGVSVQNLNSKYFSSRFTQARRVI